MLVEEGWDRKLVSPVDLLVYFVALWFVVSHILVGPIIRKWVARPLWLAEMGCNLFYVLRNKNSDFSAPSTENFRSDDPGQFEHKALIHRLAKANKSFLKPFGQRVKIDMDADNSIQKNGSKGTRSEPRILVESNRSSLKQNDESNLSSQRPSENQSLLHQADNSKAALGSSVRVGTTAKNAEEGNPFGEGGDLEQFGSFLEGGSMLFGEGKQKEFQALGFEQPSFSTASEMLLFPNRQEIGRAQGGGRGLCGW